MQFRFAVRIMKVQTQIFNKNLIFFFWVSMYLNDSLGLLSNLTSVGIALLGESQTEDLKVSGSNCRHDNNFLFLWIFQNPVAILSIEKRFTHRGCFICVVKVFFRLM